MCCDVCDVPSATVTPREARRLRDPTASSPHPLAPCHAQVDLGGALGGRSWAKPLCDTMGWTDAFLDRILMTVILVGKAVCEGCTAYAACADTNKRIH